MSHLSVTHVEDTTGRKAGTWWYVCVVSITCVTCSRLLCAVCGCGCVLCEHVYSSFVVRGMLECVCVCSVCGLCGMFGCVACVVIMYSLCYVVLVCVLCVVYVISCCVCVWPVFDVVHPVMLCVVFLTVPALTPGGCFWARTTPWPSQAGDWPPGLVTVSQSSRVVIPVSPDSCSSIRK